MLGRIAVNTLALLVVFFLIWGVHENNAIVAAIVMAVVLALVNSFIKPVILLLTLPISLLTLGLFAVVVNTLLFILAASLVHIHVGFGRGFLGWLVFVLVSAGLNSLTLFSD
jgi:putative membrane protein